MAGSACHETHSAAATNLIEDIPGPIGFAFTLAFYTNTYAKTHKACIRAEDFVATQCDPLLALPRALSTALCTLGARTDAHSWPIGLSRATCANQDA